MTRRLRVFYAWWLAHWASQPTDGGHMFKRVKAYLTAPATEKRIEQYAAIFAGAAISTAVATAESAAGTHGLQLTWSVAAGAAVAGLKAGYDAVRPAIVSLLKPAKP